MAAKRLIVVFGATGNQGGSVAKALLGDSKYAVRAVTRDPESAKSQALVSQGMEVVKGDLDDPASLKSALDGAYGLYLVTNFWAHMKKEQDTQQAKNVADAAKAAGVKHMIYSGLDAISEIIGKPCAFFDGKAEAEKYLKEIGLPHTNVHFSVYYENIFTSLRPRPNDKGELVFNVPMEGKVFPMTSVEGAGECMHSIFNDPDAYIGKTIGLASDMMTQDRYVEIINKHVPDFKFVDGGMTTAMMSNLPFPGAKDLANMFNFFQHGADRDHELTKKLNPNIKSFDQWVESVAQKYAEDLKKPPKPH